MNDIEAYSVLKCAREVYGSKNQILVCIEELNELACALAKFPRYDDEEVARHDLHDKVLDEYCDVAIIMDHVKNIMQFDDETVSQHIALKIERLERWLTQSSSMQQTIDDRSLKATSCDGCMNLGKNDTRCTTCRKAQQTEGILPFYEKE